MRKLLYSSMIVMGLMVACDQKPTEKSPQNTAESSEQAETLDHEDLKTIDPVGDKMEETASDASQELQPMTDSAKAEMREVHEAPKHGAPDAQSIKDKKAAKQKMVK